MSISVGSVLFLDIAGIEHRFCRQQVELAKGRHVAGSHRHRARGLPLAQGRQHRLHHRELLFGVLFALTGALFNRLNPAFDALEIGKQKFGHHRFRVPDGIDRALDMGDVVVVETTQHHNDGVHLADIGEKLVAQPLALGGATYQARDIDELQESRHRLGGFRDSADPLQALVRHGYPAHIRLDRAERIIRGFRRYGLRERVEKCGFSDIGKADDTTVKPHRRSLPYPLSPPPPASAGVA